MEHWPWENLTTGVALTGAKLIIFNIIQEGVYKFFEYLFFKTKLLPKILRLEVEGA